MNKSFLTLPDLLQPSTVRRALAGLVLACSLAGCKDATVPAPETGTDYYPLAVGNYWIYAVTDTTWSQATQGVPSVATASAYRVKETIKAIAADAAGLPTYQLYRAKLAPGATAYRDDSVFTVRTSAQAVVLNHGNNPTVELIFPVKAGRSWNFNAYNNSTNDTLSAETRKYSQVGQPFTTAATAGVGAKTYPNTLTTANTGNAAENSLIKRKSYQQVFAKGIGPVYRRRDYFENFYYTSTTPPNAGNVIYVAGSYFKAFSRRETLVEYQVK